MAAKLLLFAQARELAGVAEASLSLDEHPPSTARALLAHIVTRFPGLAPLEDVMVLAVNEEYADMDSPLTLTAGDEIALIPPLSGG